MQDPREHEREREYVAGQPVEGTPIEREQRVERRVVEEPVTREGYGASSVSNYELADLVRWGPILAGFAATLASLLLMGILGTALGLSTAGDMTFGTIWGALSLIVAFFVGGWIAARTVAVGGTLPAVLNSAIVWAFTLLFTLFLAGLGAAGVLGAINSMGGISLPTLQVTGEQAAGGAWGALAGLVLTLAAAIVGGMVGKHDESEFIRR